MRKQLSGGVISCGVCLLAIFQVWADAPTPSPVPHLTVPEATTLPLVNASPQDPAWASAAVIPSLDRALNASAVNVPAPATRVSVLWSPRYLYIRFICDGAVYAPFPGTDPQLYNGDVAEIFLDPVGDSHQWYEIEISPNGGLLEKNSLMANAVEFDRDQVLTSKALRGLWEDHAFTVKGLLSAAKITDIGWIADLAIPAAAILRRIGGHDLAPAALRCNFIRYQWLTGNASWYR